ncbi:hypothetical protein [Crocosphaera sp. XPORK-15E]|uniref:hypothetical protein n=1 Tax=Crocosphaera sp. XPORK-15E TaxID=3110247 RepID=UPI002B1FBD34|nr:hypothetical protein [Crocosphaera sp. XPORK-15E]MEA5535721.1 hypothetical protein [Crocosphaera sp. XPORK-15E]
MLIQEKPYDSYQLWHDYFVRFIREKQETKYQELLEQLNKEREQRIIAERSLQQVQIEIDEARTTKTNLEQQNRKAKRRVTISGVIAVSLLLVAGGTTLWTTQKIRDANNKIADANVKVNDADKKVNDANTQTENAKDEVIKANKKVDEAKIKELKATTQAQEAVKKAIEADKNVKLAQLEVENAVREQDKILQQSEQKMWNFDLDKLMNEGCGWVDGYLQSHDEEKELRDICLSKK